MELASVLAFKIQQTEEKQWEQKCKFFFIWVKPLTVILYH